MFAPLVLSAFPILIEERSAVVAEADRLGRSGQHPFIAPAPDADGVEFLHGAFREQRTRCRVGDGGSEIDAATVVRERERRFLGRVCGYTGGNTP